MLPVYLSSTTRLQTQTRGLVPIGTLWVPDDQGTLDPEKLDVFAREYPSMEWEEYSDERSWDEEHDLLLLSNCKVRRFSTPALRQVFLMLALFFQGVSGNQFHEETNSEAFQGYVSGIAWLLFMLSITYLIFTIAWLTTKLTVVAQSVFDEYVQLKVAVGNEYISLRDSAGMAYQAIVNGVTCEYKKQMEAYTEERRARFGMSVLVNAVTVFATLWIVSSLKTETIAAYLPQQGFRADVNRAGMFASGAMVCVMLLMGPIFGVKKALATVNPFLDMLRQIPLATWFYDWMIDWWHGKVTVENLPTSSKQLADLMANVPELYELSRACNRASMVSNTLKKSLAEQLQEDAERCGKDEYIRGINEICADGLFRPATLVGGRAITPWSKARAAALFRAMMKFQKSSDIAFFAGKQIPTSALMMYLWEIQAFGQHRENIKAGLKVRGEKLPRYTTNKSVYFVKSKIVPGGKQICLNVVSMALEMGRIEKQFPTLPQMVANLLRTQEYDNPEPQMEAWAQATKEERAAFVKQAAEVYSIIEVATVKEEAPFLEVPSKAVISIAPFSATTYAQAVKGKFYEPLPKSGPGSGEDEAESLSDSDDAFKAVLEEAEELVDDEDEESKTKDKSSAVRVKSGKLYVPPEVLSAATHEDDSLERDTEYDGVHHQSIREDVKTWYEWLCTYVTTSVDSCCKRVFSYFLKPQYTEIENEFFEREFQTKESLEEAKIGAFDQYYEDTKQEVFELWDEYKGRILAGFFLIGMFATAYFRMDRKTLTYGSARDIMDEKFVLAKERIAEIRAKYAPEWWLKPETDPDLVNAVLHPEESLILSQQGKDGEELSGKAMKRRRNRLNKRKRLLESMSPEQQIEYLERVAAAEKQRDEARNKAESKVVFSVGTASVAPVVNVDPLIAEPENQLKGSGGEEDEGDAFGENSHEENYPEEDRSDSGYSSEEDPRERYSESQTQYEVERVAPVYRRYIGSSPKYGQGESWADDDYEDPYAYLNGQGAAEVAQALRDQFVTRPTEILEAIRFAKEHLVPALPNDKATLWAEMQKEIKVLPSQALAVSKISKAVYKFYVNDQYVSTATLVGDKMYVVLHGMSTNLDAQYRAANIGSNIVLDFNTFVAINREIGYFKVSGISSPIKQRGAFRVLQKSEIVSILGFGSGAGAEPDMIVGFATPEGWCNAVTRDGDCSSPVLTADGKIVGFWTHGNGKVVDTFGRFEPVTDLFIKGLVSMGTPNVHRGLLFPSCPPSLQH